jgi:hypothetical protein
MGLRVLRGAGLSECMVIGDGGRVTIVGGGKYFNTNLRYLSSRW